MRFGDWVYIRAYNLFVRVKKNECVKWDTKVEVGGFYEV